MMMATRSISLLVLTMLVASACGSGRRSGPQVGPAGVAREIVVENNISIDIQVSAVVGVTIYALGTVRGQSSRSIRIPTQITGSFRMMAEPRGNASMANRLYSEPISITQVNQATWEIRQGISVVSYGRRGALRP